MLADGSTARHRRPPLRGRRGTGRCARARRDTLRPRGAYGRSNNFALFPGFFMLSSREPPIEARGHFHHEDGAVYSRLPHRRGVVRKARARPRYVALNTARLSCPGQGFGGMAAQPVHYFFLRFSRARLLVDVGAAYPLRRVEIRAAVFLLELLRGARRDHVCPGSCRPSPASRRDRAPPPACRDRPAAPPCCRAGRGRE